jgi:hypothetical protein
MVEVSDCALEQDVALGGLSVTEQEGRSGLRDDYFVADKLD